MNFSKTYQLTDKRIVDICCEDDTYIIVIKDLDNVKKQVVFNGCRWASFVSYISEIDEAVQKLDDELTPQKYCQHLGRAWYVSVTPGYRCVDFRRWYRSADRQTKPTRDGIALRLGEWTELKDLVATIHQELPTLFLQLPCYHLGQLDWMECRECLPFGADDL
jgi:hypothetical protein